MNNPWDDYSDEELIDHLRNHPSELKLARAAPDWLASLRKSRLIIALQAAGEFTSPEMVEEIQAESFGIIMDVCGG
jgi:hypothetical protein